MFGKCKYRKSPRKICSDSSSCVASHHQVRIVWAAFFPWGCSGERALLSGPKERKRGGGRRRRSSCRHKTHCCPVEKRTRKEEDLNSSPPSSSPFGLAHTHWGGDPNFYRRQKGEEERGGRKKCLIFVILATTTTSSSSSSSSDRSAYALLPQKTLAANPGHTLPPSLSTLG